MFCFDERLTHRLIYEQLYDKVSHLVLKVKVNHFTNGNKQHSTTSSMLNRLTRSDEREVKENQDDLSTSLKISLYSFFF